MRDFIHAVTLGIGFVVLVVFVAALVAAAVMWIAEWIGSQPSSRARNKAAVDKIANQLAELNILADIAKARLASLEPRTQTLERQMTSALDRIDKLESLPKKTNPRKDICPPRAAPKSKKP